MKTLLFVCSGNTDRSPAAQYLAQEYIDRGGLAIAVRSGGTNVRAGSAPGDQLATALPAARSHVPTPLDQAAIEGADLILTMNRQHRRIVVEMAQNAENKTCCLYEYVDGSARAVVDPVDFGPEDYADFLDEMRRLARLAVDRLAASQPALPLRSGLL